MSEHQCLCCFLKGQGIPGGERKLGKSCMCLAAKEAESFPSFSVLESQPLSEER